MSFLPEKLLKKNPGLMFSFWKRKGSGVFDYGLLGADMHSHLIPGIDDGSPDTETSLGLIRGLKALGYRKLVTTPHIMRDMYPNTAAGILEQFEKLQEIIRSAAIDVELGVAAEYFLDDHLREILKKKQRLLTISKNMVLVEFSMASEPLNLKEILFELQLQGYTPVIAHPERYIYHERNRSFFEDLKSSGYLFQLNILSLTGFYGRSPFVLAHDFIKKGFYDLAGTDLHNVRHLKALENPKLKTELSRLLESSRLLNAEI